MNYNTLNSEFVFSLLLKHYPQITSNLIGYSVNVHDLKLEAQFFNRRVDLICKINSIRGNRKLFIENQLTCSDKVHLNQLFYIIEELQRDQKATIIWVAKSFDEDHLNKVTSKLNTNGKNIEFIAVQIKEDLIRNIQILSEIDEFQVIENLEYLFTDYENNLEIVFRYYNKHIEVQDTKDNQDKIQLNQKELMVEKIKDQIESTLYYFPNSFRSKKTGYRISYGSGLEGVSYLIGINKYCEVFVYLRFSEHRKEIFDSIYENRKEVEDELGFPIIFDTRYLRVSKYETYFPKQESKIIKKQVDVLEAFILFFANYQRSIYCK